MSMFTQYQQWYESQGYSSQQSYVAATAAAAGAQGYSTQQGYSSAYGGSAGGYGANAGAYGTSAGGYGTSASAYGTSAGAYGASAYGSGYGTTGYSTSGGYLAGSSSGGYAAYSTPQPAAANSTQAAALTSYFSGAPTTKPPEPTTPSASSVQAAAIGSAYQTWLKSQPAKTSQKWIPPINQSFVSQDKMPEYRQQQEAAASANTVQHIGYSTPTPLPSSVTSKPEYMMQQQTQEPARPLPKPGITGTNFRVRKEIPKPENGSNAVYSMMRQQLEELQKNAGKTEEELEAELQKKAEERKEREALEKTLNLKRSVDDEEPGAGITAKLAKIASGPVGPVSAQPTPTTKKVISLDVVFNKDWYPAHNSPNTVLTSYCVKMKWQKPHWRCGVDGDNFFYASVVVNGVTYVCTAPDTKKKQAEQAASIVFCAANDMEDGRKYGKSDFYLLQNSDSLLNQLTEMGPLYPDNEKDASELKLEELEAEGVETEDKKKKKKKKKKKNPNTIRLQDQVNPAQTVVVEGTPMDSQSTEAAAATFDIAIKAAETLLQQ